MSLVYDATGRKWFKYGEFGTTSYASGIEYLDGKLEAIYAPDGRMVAEYTGGTITRYRAEYFHQDHLGNTRLVFSDFNQNGIVDLEDDDPATPLNELEITQESHYYPFGMNHLGPWYETVAPENKYLYNGKELNADYEINLYEYGARWYDPAVGRFTGVDPIAEEFPWVSTYNYAENEPVANIDLHGLQKVRYSVIAEKIVGNDNRGIIRTATPEMRERNSFKAGLADATAFLLAPINTIDNIIATASDENATNEDVVNEFYNAWTSNIGGTGKMKTSRAARREVMRQEGIPTSQQPRSQSKNASGREYTYEVPKGGGGTQTKSVQQQTMDRNHEGAHWEAGKVKEDPRTGEVRMNEHGRPKLQNDKSKVYYDEKRGNQ